MNIDDWLGTAGGSGSATTPAQGPGRIATDHVHDLNLPLRLPQGMPSTVSHPAANPKGLSATPPHSPGSAHADPWAALETGWNAAPAGTPSANGKPETAAKAGFTTPAAPQDLDFDALFGEGLSADPFQDPSWFGAAQQTPAPYTTESLAPLAVTPAVPGRAGSIADEHDIDAHATPVVLARGGPDAPGRRRSDVQAAGAFARGLGLAQTPNLDDAAWERIGEAVRLIVSGLIELLNARADLKRELRVEDRTMLASRDNNPLKTGIDLESALQYLLIARGGMAGYKPADVALKEAVDELRVHELATVAASRAAVEAALREFDPETLRKKLSPGKSRLPQFFDSSRMWEAYVDRYEKQGAQMADWLEKIFSRHFVPAYSRESERLKMTMAGPKGEANAR